jgi:hypothetical protein
MPKFNVDVEGATYEVEAPNENTAWRWANTIHLQDRAANTDVPITDEYGKTVSPKTQAAPEPTLGQQVVGAGETALALSAGGLAGGAGMIGGTLKGLAEQLLSGQFGTQQAADAVEQAATQGAQTLAAPFMPRSQTGQEMTQAAGEALAPLAAVAPMTAELGAIAQGTRMAAPAVLATAERAAPAVSGAIQKVAQTLKPGAVEVPAPVQAAGEATIPPVQAAAVPAVAPLASAELSATAKEAATGTGRSQTRAQKILAGQAAPDQETIAAAKRLGIDDNLQADHVTTNQSFRELSQAVKSMPGSAARSQEMEGLQAVGRRADDLMTELGGTKDVSTLSSNIKNNMVQLIDDLDHRANSQYDQIRQNIPAGTRAAAPNTLKFIDERISALGGRDNLSPLEKSIVKKLSPKSVTTIEKTPGQVGITSPSTVKTQSEVQPLYGLMDDVRKTVGQAARMGGPFKDADTGLAKKLYGLITSDQDAAVKPLGMTELIDAAKATVRMRKGLEDDTVSLFGKNLGNSIVGNLAGGTAALGKGDTSKFVKLITAVPQNMRQDVAASALNYAFGKATQNGSLNFNTFARWWEGLEKNKQAKAVLMANLPKEARQNLADLYRISNGIAASSKERIVTGRLNAITKELEGTDSAMQKIYDVAKKSAGIMAAEVATTSIGAPGVGLASGITSALMKSKPEVMKAADKLISDPTFIAMAKASAKGEPLKPAAVKTLAKSKAMITFKKALNNPPELNNVEQWLAGLFLSESQQNNQGRNNVLH